MQAVPRNLPLRQIGEELQPERNLSHNLLVQVLIRYAEHSAIAREPDGLKLTPVNLEITRSKFDLGVFVAEQEGDAAGYWLYSTELFE